LEGYDIIGGTYWFIYPCQNGKSCFTTFIMESVDEAYGENLKSLEKMLDTLNVGHRYAK
jgi:hypothetical protein